MSQSKNLTNLIPIIPLTLQSKTKHLILCNFCSFFPTFFELSEHIMTESIYELKWLCSFCKNTNLCSTDIYYKYYCYNHIYTLNWKCQESSSSCKGGMIIDRKIYHKKQIIVYIDVGIDMLDEWIWLNSSVGKRGNIIEMNKSIKKQLIIESVLLKAYLEAQARKLRLQKGKYFSWQNFLKQKSLSKIQYALWLTDKIINQSKKQKVQIHFFLQQSKQCKQRSVLTEKILTIFHKLHPNCTSMIQNQLFEHTQQNHENQTYKQFLIISASPLKSIIQRCSLFLKKSHTLIINLQQIYDPIHLQPTSTYLYHKKIQPHSHTHSHSHSHHQQKQQIKIFDSRLYQLNSIKETKQIILQILQQDNNQLNIFINKSKNNSQSNQIHSPTNITTPKKNTWQKIIDRNIYRNILWKSFRQKDKHKDKQKDKDNYKFKVNNNNNNNIIIQCNDLIKKQGWQSISDIQNYLYTKANEINKDHQIRITLKFISHIKYNQYDRIKQINNINDIYNNNNNLYQYTILWCKSKFDNKYIQYNNIMNMLNINLIYTNNNNNNINNQYQYQYVTLNQQSQQLSWMKNGQYSQDKQNNKYVKYQSTLSSNSFEQL